MINGGADGGTGSVNYYLDGGINMTGLRNTGNILPNPDAIQEFRVQTNSYNAEYGRFSSGIINVVTKSGTNKYKGSVFEYVRNGKMNAKEWGSLLATPPLKRNQFGGTLGGPIVHDRTFFFTTYSGLRQTTNTFLNTAIVPTALERTGDFSASRTLPTDPATGQTFVCNGVVGVICPNRLDPVAMKIINDYIPLSNVAGSIWQGFVPSPYDTDEVLVKVDHQMNTAHRFSGNYFLTKGSNTVKAGSGQPAVGQPGVQVAAAQRQSQRHLGRSAPTGSTRPGSRSTATSAAASTCRRSRSRDLGSTAIIQGAPSLPQITVSGFFTLTNAIGGPKAGGDFYSVRDVFSWTRGAHALKMGGELSLQQDHPGHAAQQLRRPHVQQQRDQERAGRLPDRHSQRDDAGRAGHRALEQLVRRRPSCRTTTASTRRMTLNLGLRWDVQTPGTDPLNRFSTYVPGQKSTVRPAAPTGQLFYGDPGIERGVIKTAWNHLSPRVGFVWDPFGDGKTSIRAAGGIFYGSISGNEWNTMTNFQPWSTRLTFTNINADDERGRRAATALRSAIPTTTTSAARRSPTTVRTPTAAASSAWRRTSSGRAPTRPTSACSARSASRWPSARPTSGRSPATCRSSAT